MRVEGREKRRGGTLGKRPGKMIENFVFFFIIIFIVSFFLFLKNIKKKKYHTQAN